MSAGDVNTREEFNSVMAERNYGHSRCFDNLFTFLDFCQERRLSQDNSVTYYNEVTGVMSIAY